MKKLQIILSMVFVAYIGSPAYAGQDGKIYPGAMCQRHSGSTDYSHSSGVFKNNSTKHTLTVVCPVIKDVMAKHIHDGWMKVVDLHKKENFVCSVKSKYRKDNGTWKNYWSGNKYSKDYGTHTQTLYFGGFGHVSGGSHYYVVCTIPPKDKYNGSSYLMSYRVDEND